MREVGVVKKGGRIAEVVVLRRSACGENCAHCNGGCTPTKTVINADNPINAVPGERVLLEMPDKNALLAAFMTYMIPLAALVIGSGTAYAANLSEGLCAICGVGAMAASVAVVRPISKKLQRKFAVTIADVIGK